MGTIDVSTNAMQLADNMCKMVGASPEFADIIDWDSVKKFYPDDYQYIKGRVNEKLVWELSRDCPIGANVKWKTIVGKEFQGVLKEWDNCTAIIIEKESGKQVAIRADRG